MSLEVFVDVETTGLVSHRGRDRVNGIVEVGIAWRNGSEVCTWSELCNPGRQFLPNAIKTIRHMESRGKKYAISPAMIIDAASENDAATRFHDQLESLGDDIAFRAFNNNFDKGFLTANPWNLGQKNWGQCVMQQSKQHFQRQMSLARVMAAFGIDWPPGDQHRAEIDAHAALLVADALAIQTSD